MEEAAFAEDSLVPDEVEENEPEQVEEITSPKKSPKLNEYWKIKNGETNFLYAVIADENPSNIQVQYFVDDHGQGLRLEEDIWPIFDEDLDQKVSPPEIKNVSKYRKFYNFI